MTHSAAPQSSILLSPCPAMPLHILQGAPHGVPPRTTLAHHAPQCHIMPHNTSPCSTGPHHAALWPTICSISHTMPNNALLCPTMTHYEPPCHNMPHYAPPCHTMPHHAPPCPTMPAASPLEVATGSISRGIETSPGKAVTSMDKEKTVNRRSTRDEREKIAKPEHNNKTTANARATGSACEV